MRRLLLVEDDDDTLLLTSELLMLYGFEVECAATHERARQLLESQVFDLVLADLYVDSQESAASWRGIRALRRAAGITPVALLTASRPSGADVQQSGVAFAIAKPFTAEDLLDKISACVQLPALSASGEELLRSYFGSLEDANWDQLASLCSEDVVYHVPGTDPALSRTATGRAAFIATAVDTFTRFPDPRFDIHTLRSMPEGALVRYVGSWRNDQGAREQIDGAVLFRLAGDRIVEIGVRVDLQTLRQRTNPATPQRMQMSH